MYKHILVQLKDNNEFEFFNVKEFDYNSESDTYILLSQNDEFHIFPKDSIKRLVL